MDQFLLHLRLLNSVLEKKIRALAQILNITENQMALLSARAGDTEVIRLHSGLLREKQKLIGTVNESDKVFEHTYKAISPVFETEAPKHAGLIKRMQENVKRATALDARIRVREARINTSPRKTDKIAGNISTRKRVARMYEKNNRRADG